MTPALSQPKLNVVLDVQHSPSPRNPYLLEVTLFLNAQCDNAGNRVFEAKMQYTGMFRIDDPNLASQPSVIDFCAAQIYPQLRREFANRTLLGGFQGLLLHDRHLETCLHKLFMGSKTPQAGFSRIFGTLYHQRSQGVMPATPSRTPPKKLGVVSRRLLRNPWILPVLLVPVILVLVGGIHWWEAHRVPSASAPSALAKTPEPAAAVPPPTTLATTTPAPSPAAVRLKALAETGDAWLAAQPGSHFTLVISKGRQAETAIDVVTKLTLNDPAFLVVRPDDAFVVTGSYRQKKDAALAAERFGKAHRGIKAEIVSIAALAGRP